MTQIKSHTALTILHIYIYYEDLWKRCLNFFTVSKYSKVPKCEQIYEVSLLTLKTFASFGDLPHVRLYGKSIGAGTDLRAF